MACGSRRGFGFSERNTTTGTPKRRRQRCGATARSAKLQRPDERCHILTHHVRLTRTSSVAVRCSAKMCTASSNQRSVLEIATARLLDPQDLAVLAEIDDVADALATAVERVVHHRPARGSFVVAD